MRLPLSMLMLTALIDIASAAQMPIPDVCQGSVCLTKMVWKKGFTVHTLTGTLTTQKDIQSINIALTFSDSKRSGSTALHLRNVTKPTDFFFKISNMPADGIKWEQSALAINAWAVHDIATMERNGLVCQFRSLGSRLETSIRNKTTKDLILDYSMLMISAGDTNLKLNGSTGKYIDLDKPRPNSLIPDGTTHREELIPMNAAKLEGGDWVESWTLQDALTMSEPKLFVPFIVDGKQQIEKIPLQVDFTKLATLAKVPEKK